MEREGGRVLNLDGRDEVMNINLFNPKRSCLHGHHAWFLLCPECHHNFLLRLGSLCVSVSVFLCFWLVSVSLSFCESLSFSFGSGFGRGDGQRPCYPHLLPWSQEALGRRVEKEGMAFTGLPIGAAG